MAVGARRALGRVIDVVLLGGLLALAVAGDAPVLAVLVVASILSLARLGALPPRVETFLVQGSLFGLLFEAADALFGDDDPFHLGTAVGIGVAYGAIAALTERRGEEA